MPPLRHSATRERERGDTMKTGYLCCLTMLAVAGQLTAQTLSLPKFDGVSGFYRRAHTPTSSPWQAQPIAPCAHTWQRSMCGWGFETIYQIRGEKEPEKPKKWHGELAVGYDFLNVSAKPNNKADYIFLGSIQTLPSITYYLNRDLPHRFGLYGGVGTGLVVLKNFRAYDSVGNTYGISGDTRGVTGSGGRVFFCDASNAPTAGVHLFPRVA